MKVTSNRAIHSESRGRKAWEFPAFFTLSALCLITVAQGASVCTTRCLLGPGCAPGTTTRWSITGAVGDGSIWGTDEYTGDSDMQAAALHQGIVALGETADISIACIGGRTSYTGTTANGVTTQSYGAYGEAAVLHRLEISTCTGACLNIGACVAGYSVLLLVQGTSNSLLWGTGTYTHDSDVQSASVHTGTGSVSSYSLVYATCYNSQTGFASSTANGITSQAFAGSWPQTFSVGAAPPAFPTPAPAVVAATTCTTNCLRFQCGTPGDRHYLEAQGVVNSNIWGTDIYSDDTEVPVAAVHFGILNPGQTRKFWAECVAAQGSLTGSTRNGVTSQSQGASSENFQLEMPEFTKTMTMVPPTPAPPPTCTADCLNGQCETIYERKYITVTGASLNNVAWGTDLYTDDSNVQAVAVHMGLLASGETGVVEVICMGATSTFISTTRNGVTTKAYGNNWDNTFALKAWKTRTVTVTKTASPTPTETLVPTPTLSHPKTPTETAVPTLTLSLPISATMSPPITATPTFTPPPTRTKSETKTPGPTLTVHSFTRTVTLPESVSLTQSPPPTLTPPPTETKTFTFTLPTPTRVFPPTHTVTETIVETDTLTSATLPPTQTRMPAKTDTETYTIGTTTIRPPTRTATPTRGATPSRALSVTTSISPHLRFQPRNLTLFLDAATYGGGPIWSSGPSNTNVSAEVLGRASEYYSHRCKAFVFPPGGYPHTDVIRVPPQHLAQLDTANATLEIMFAPSAKTKTFMAVITANATGKAVFGFRLRRVVSLQAPTTRTPPSTPAPPPPSARRNDTNTTVAPPPPPPSQDNTTAPLLQLEEQRLVLHYQTPNGTLATGDWPNALIPTGQATSAVFVFVNHTVCCVVRGIRYGCRPVRLDFRATGGWWLNKDPSANNAESFEGALYAISVFARAVEGDELDTRALELEQVIGGRLAGYGNITSMITGESRKEPNVTLSNHTVYVSHWHDNTVDIDVGLQGDTWSHDIANHSYDLSAHVLHGGSPFGARSLITADGRVNATLSAVTSSTMRLTFPKAHCADVVRGETLRLQVTRASIQGPLVPGHPFIDIFFVPDRTSINDIADSVVFLLCCVFLVSSVVSCFVSRSHHESLILITDVQAVIVCYAGRLCARDAVASTLTIAFAAPIALVLSEDQCIILYAVVATLAFIASSIGKAVQRKHDEKRSKKKPAGLNANDLHQPNEPHAEGMHQANLSTGSDPFAKTPDSDIAEGISVFGGVGPHDGGGDSGGFVFGNDMSLSVSQMEQMEDMVMDDVITEGTEDSISDFEGNDPDLKKRHAIALTPIKTPPHLRRDLDPWLITVFLVSSHSMRILVPVLWSAKLQTADWMVVGASICVGVHIVWALVSTLMKAAKLHFSPPQTTSEMQHIFWHQDNAMFFTPMQFAKCLALVLPAAVPANTDTAETCVGALLFSAVIGTVYFMGFAVVRPAKDNLANIVGIVNALGPMGVFWATTVSARTCSAASADAGLYASLVFVAVSTVSLAVMAAHAVYIRFLERQDAKRMRQMTKKKSMVGNKKVEPVSVVVHTPRRPSMNPLALRSAKSMRSMSISGMSGSGSMSGKSPSASWRMEPSPQGAHAVVEVHGKSKSTVSISDVRVAEGVSSPLNADGSPGAPRRSFTVGFTATEDTSPNGGAFIRSRHASHVSARSTNGEDLAMEDVPEDLGHGSTSQHNLRSPRRSVAFVGEEPAGSPRNPLSRIGSTFSMRSARSEGTESADLEVEEVPDGIANSTSWGRLRGSKK